MKSRAEILFNARIPRQLHQRLVLLVRRRPYLSSLRAALVLALSAGLDALDRQDTEGGA